MGMAASQARYLALTARKTNTEWEGQQINQARTALANQSANLFNQLLSMEVPNPPKTTDYTELQYSYTDGENESVIESWHSLANDNNYNYVVNHYYFADIYTGAQKLLQDPQVQMKKVMQEIEYDPKTVNIVYDEQGNVTVTAKYKQGNVEEDRTYDKITEQEVIEDKELESALRDFETAKNLAKADGTLNTDNVFGYRDTDGTWHFFLTKEDPVSGTDTKGNLSIQYFNGDAVAVKNNDTGITYNVIDENKTASSQQLYNQLMIYEEENDLLDENGNLTFNGIFGDIDDNGNWTFIHPDIDLTKTTTVPYDNKDYAEVYAPAFVGNSPLKELKQLTVDDQINQVAELAQILRDCPDSSMNKYLSFDTDGNLVYDGSGIFTFEMFGKTYYTTREDLDNSVGKPYDPSKPIDLQEKLAYYNASYIQKKIESTNNALLETDSEGRFKSVKFDNNSISYSLNVETVTDEEAYQNAMNEYLYKKQQYEKTIADINAKTEVIQQEDRTLELRLKQLDTEQLALSTEMDAVKKVIKDNVEKTFKTFSD